MSQLVELEPILVRRLRRPAVGQPPKSVPPRRVVPGSEGEGERTESASPRSAFHAKARRPRPQVNSNLLWIGLGAVVLALLSPILPAFGQALATPFAATLRSGREIRGLKTSLASARTTNQQIRDDIAYLRTPAGVEQEARRRGYVRPGEIALTLVPNDPTPPAAAPRTAVAAGPPSTVSERIREAVESCLAVLGLHSRTR